MNRTALILALSLFALFLVLGFAADAVTGTTQQDLIGLSLLSLLGAVFAAVFAAAEAWDTRNR